MKTRTKKKRIEEINLLVWTNGKRPDIVKKKKKSFIKKLKHKFKKIF